MTRFAIFGRAPPMQAQYFSRPQQSGNLFSFCEEAVTPRGPLNHLKARLGWVHPSRRERSSDFRSGIMLLPDGIDTSPVQAPVCVHIRNGSSSARRPRNPFLSRPCHRCGEQDEDSPGSHVLKMLPSDLPWVVLARMVPAVPRVILHL